MNEKNTITKEKKKQTKKKFNNLIVSEAQNQN